MVSGYCDIGLKYDCIYLYVYIYIYIVFCCLNQSAAPPSFTTKLFDIIGKEGSSVHLRCSTDDDVAMVDWFINGRLLLPSEKYKATSEGAEHTLTIHDLSLQDNDAEVTAMFGDKQTSARLTVRG